MKIRFLRPYRNFKPGDSYDGYGAGVCETLITRGIAESAEKAVERSPADKMLRPHKVTRKAFAQ